MSTKEIGHDKDISFHLKVSLNEKFELNNFLLKCVKREAQHQFKAGF